MDTDRFENAPLVPAASISLADLLGHEFEALGGPASHYTFSKEEVGLVAEQWFWHGPNRGWERSTCNSNGVNCRVDPITFPDDEGGLARVRRLVIGRAMVARAGYGQAKAIVTRDDAEEEYWRRYVQARVADEPHYTALRTASANLAA